MSMDLVSGSQQSVGTAARSEKPRRKKPAASDRRESPRPMDRSPASLATTGSLVAGDPPGIKTQGAKPRVSTGATVKRADQASPGHPSPTKEDHMAVTTERSATATAIRPFTVEFPEADVADLRARIAATRFPEREPVEDPIVHPLGEHRPAAGRRVGDDGGTRALLGHRVRPSEGRGAAERPAAVPDRDRRSRYSLHPRQVASRERVAGDPHLTAGPARSSSC